MIKFNCKKGGDHEVALKDAKNPYYQYASNGRVMARGTCPKDGTNLSVFISKEKVPSGEKIRVATPSTKKSHKKSKKGGECEGGKRSKRSKKSHKKSEDGEEKKVKRSKKSHKKSKRSHK